MNSSSHGCRSYQHCSSSGVAVTAYLFVNVVFLVVLLSIEAEAVADTM
jgi:hypothetical protein